MKYARGKTLSSTNLLMKLEKLRLEYIMNANENANKNANADPFLTRI